MQEKGQSTILVVVAIVLCFVAFGAGILISTMTGSSTEEFPSTPVKPAPAETQKTPAETTAPPDSETKPREDLSEKVLALEPIQTPDDKPDLAEEPDTEEPPETKRPTGKQSFRWDFSSEYKFVYEYVMNATTNVGGQVGKQDATGKLTVDSKGNKSADLTLSNIVFEQEPDTHIPSTMVRDFSEDSKFSHTIPTEDTVDEIYFALPPESLEVGESVTIPSRKTWTASNHAAWARGSTDITLKDYVLIDGHYCAKFELKTDISKPEVPPGILGEYTFSLTGTATTFFDTVDKCFRSGEFTSLMIITVALGEMKQEVKLNSTIKFTRSRDKEKEANQK
jgi:hypothetical protein